MVPWFHPIFGKVEPWNHGTKVPGYTFWVPWFHGSTQFFGGWNHGTMEPRFQATHFGFHGSMVPPKNSMSRIKNFVGWNHGTMEPRFQATQKRFHGSMVPPKFFLGGTMEPWNHGTGHHKKPEAGNRTTAGQFFSMSKLILFLLTNCDFCVFVGS